MGTHAQSAFVDVGGPVHVLDFGGRPDGPAIVCVHGLGGSSTAWRAFADAVGSSYRVLAVDLPGHGRSPSRGRSVSVRGAAEVLQGVIAELFAEPVVLVGHSMGAMVSVLTTASTPGAVDRLLLLAPPLPREGVRLVNRELLPHVAMCLWPRLGAVALQRRLSRQTLEEYVRDRLRLTCASAADLAEVAEAMAAEMQAAYDDGEDPLLSFIHAARSVGMLVAEARRYREVLQRVRQPVRVVHGELDRVLSPASLDQLASLGAHWQTHLLPTVGHSPHLEEPELVARVLNRLLGDRISEPSSLPATHVERSRSRATGGPVRVPA